MKVNELVKELLSLCQLKKVEGFIFLREKETVIYLAEELSKGNIRKRNSTKYQFSQTFLRN